jgi:hypothetical protein
MTDNRLTPRAQYSQLPIAVIPGSTRSPLKKAELSLRNRSSHLIGE